MSSPKPSEGQPAAEKRPTDTLMERTIGGFAWTAMGGGAQSLANIAIVVVLARLLSPSEFGILSAALVVMNAALMIAEIGVGPAVVHMTGITKHHVHVALGLSAVAGISLAALLVSSAPAIAGFFGMPELGPVVRTMALLLPLSAVSAVLSAVMQRSMAFRALATVQLLSFVIGYGALGVVLAYLGFGTWSLVAAHVGQTVIRFVLLAYSRRTAIGFAYSRPAATALLGYGVGHTLTSIANLVATQGDFVVVGRLLGATALGAYSRAYQFLMLPANLLGANLDKVLFPVFASIQDDRARLSRAYLRAFGLVALVTMPLGAIIAVSATELVTVALGAQWKESATALRYLILFLVFRTAYRVAGTLTRAVGAVYRRAWRESVYAACVIGGAWIGVLLGDVAYVAVGVGFAILINFLMLQHLATQLVGVRWGAIATTLTRHGSVAIAVAMVAMAMRWFALNEAWAAPFVLISTFAAAAVTWLSVWKLAPTWLGPERTDSHQMLCRIAGRIARRSNRAQ